MATPDAKACSGDNFGVQIQEDVLNELSRAQESAYNLRDVARAQHFTRAKLCAKLIKYPNVEDYVVCLPFLCFFELVYEKSLQISLRDHDEKQLYMARQHMYDIRNVYAILFDILQKVSNVYALSYHYTDGCWCRTSKK